MIERCDLPPAALLRRYDDGHSYADCYTTDVDGAVDTATFVEAFYCTGLFKVERTLLAWLARRPASDADARRLATGSADTFSAWRVESRSEGQLLVQAGRTRSWFMTGPAGGDSTRTRLYFGSAVVALPRSGSGARRLGFAFHALLGFHKLYTRALLRAARAKVESGGGGRITAR
jgi:hypothetical protein